MDRRGGLLVFGLELLYPHLADSPPGRREQSTWPGVHPARRLFLRIRGLIRRRSDVLLQGVCGPSARVSRTIRAVQVTLKPSACRVQTVGISGCSIGCSRSFYGPSVVVSQTVCLVLADRRPSHLGPSAPGTVDCLCPLLLELRFRVALSWGLFLGLVGLF
jgi:hypothetical protein